MGETVAVKLSLWPAASQNWTELLEVAVHADTAGWHCLYLEDHFMGDGGGFGSESEPRLEVTSALAALAVATSRIRLAPLVLSATYRHPVVVANWAITMDRMSAGRFTLGLGAGWQINEHEQYGIELGSPGARVERLAGYCAVVSDLVSGRERDLDGEFFMLIGGKGDRMLRLVAKHADLWNMWALPELFAQRSDVLDQACALLGRDPRTIGRSTQALVLLTADPQVAREFVEAHALEVAEEIDGLLRNGAVFI